VTASAALQPIWIVKRVGVVQPERVAAYEHCKRRAGTGLKDATELPVVNHCLKKAVVPFQAWQHPGPTDDGTLSQIEIGRAHCYEGTRMHRRETGRSRISLWR
jgi:hypothetical protein